MYWYVENIKFKFKEYTGNFFKLNKNVIVLIISCAVYYNSKGNFFGILNAQNGNLDNFF